MSKAKKSWMTWRCSDCGRRHKNQICCDIEAGQKYYWEWICDKCQKKNRINVVVIEEEYYEIWRNNYRYY